MRRKDIDLWFEDECHFQQHGSRCAMWIPPEEDDPVVQQAPTRKQVAVFGAVNPRTGRLVTMKSETFDAASVKIFLRRLLRKWRRGRKIVLVLDNARWHHSKELKPWLKKNSRKIRLEFLPPYSPELNPVERVWKLARRLCTHNQYFEKIEDMIVLLDNQFCKWKHENNQLYLLCAIN